MKPCKIAVCFSGESRTWKHCVDAIKYFFSSNYHDIKFFGHTWDESYYLKADVLNRNPKYKIKHDKNILHNELVNAFNFSDLIVEDRSKFQYFSNDFFEISHLVDACHSFPAQNAANFKRPATWDQMSYSIMMANELKTKYELDNFMQFDIVVRARFDVVYYPEVTFESYVNRLGPIEPCTLFCNINYFPNEFGLVNMCDIFYFGGSSVMNIIDGFYRYWGDGTFWKMDQTSYFDPAMKVGGYNINLYKWACQKNIWMKHFSCDKSLYTIWSEEQNHVWPMDYPKIKDTFLYQPHIKDVPP